MLINIILWVDENICKAVIQLKKRYTYKFHKRIITREQSFKINESLNDLIASKQ